MHEPGHQGVRRAAACGGGHTVGRTDAPPATLHNVTRHRRRSRAGDAARRSGLPAATLRVDRAEAVTWRDGSLGCPQPGMAYTQALVPGYRVRVIAGDRVMDYHAGRSGAPQWCPPGRAQDPLSEDARR